MGNPLTEVNVGPAGGDLASRRFGLVVTAALTVMAVPTLGVNDATLRLAGLMVAIFGTLFLMAGLVFLQRTHYAGIMLILAASGIMALARPGGRPGAVAVGLSVMALMAANLLNHRCALNRLLGINSCR
jgi:hypothetical protein